MRMEEFKAKTTEEAISLGLEKLGVSFEDVKIEVVEEGSKGFLGLLGVKPAVVRLTVREDLEDTDVLKAVGLTRDEETATVKEKAEKAKAKAKPEAPKAEKPAKTEAKPAKTEKAPKAEAPKRAKTEKAPKAEEPKKEAPAKAAAPATEGEAEARAVEFLSNVTKMMGVEVSITPRRDEEGNLRVDMMGDTLGILIGRRGETLDALQYLTSLFVNRGQENYIRVTLDTENYRAKREEALTRLANRMANRAVKTGRKVVMEPMNPYERRILHSALQGNDAVTTHSEGDEPNRHVVITLK
ncbi:MAG: protein jag [Clostridiales bacterium]|nr:protein jag [Clostridiales bacterium]